jgi:hypothetical protein
VAESVTLDESGKSRGAWEGKKPSVEALGFWMLRDKGLKPALPKFVF